MSLSHALSRSAYWIRAIAAHPANRGARSAAVRRAARWHLRSRGGDAEALVTVDGRTRVIARPGQFAAVWTLYDGVHEWEELQFCFGFLRPGDHFVDVGANVGVFSAFVGTRVPGVRVTAIEPFPGVMPHLRQNLAVNHLDVEVLDIAVGAEPGEVSFEILDRDVLNRVKPGGSEGASITVPVQRLDTLFPERTPNLIKIDVEGFELKVLQGASGLLDAEDAPVLLFEQVGHGIHFGVTPGDVNRYLADHGYGVYLPDHDLTPWDGDGLPPHSNLVAARDVDAVRRRLAEPNDAPVRPPVRVDVRYLRADERRAGLDVGALAESDRR